MFGYQCQSSDGWQKSLSHQNDLQLICNIAYYVQILYKTVQKKKLLEGLQSSDGNFLKSRWFFTVKLTL